MEQQSTKTFGLLKKDISIEVFHLNEETYKSGPKWVLDEISKGNLTLDYFSIGLNEDVPVFQIAISPGNILSGISDECCLLKFSSGAILLMNTNDYKNTFETLTLKNPWSIESKSSPPTPPKPRSTSDNYIGDCK